MNPAREQLASLPISQRDDLRVGFSDSLRRARMKSRPPLRQGHDPAADLYREQAKRDADAAHRWLEQQKKAI